MSTEPLFVSFFSILVKRAAVARSFPGGVEGFERRHKPARLNASLFVLVCMSLDDVDHLLGNLYEEDLIPGTDIAVADMTHGPLLACSGVEFVYTGEDLGTRWTANVSNDPGASKASRVELTAYSPNPLGFRWEAPVLRAPSVSPEETVSNPWRRIVGPSGLVCWVGDEDDEDEDDPLEPPSDGGAKVDNTQHSAPPGPLNSPPAAPGGQKHTISVQYTSVLLASNGHMGHPEGEHSIEVDGETFARIKAGEEMHVEGHGMHSEGEGLVSDDWLFNARGPGTAVFFLYREDGSGPEDFEAIAIWFDGEPQPPPRGWWD